LNDPLTISLGIGLLVLYVLLLPLMTGTTRTLRRQNQQLGELLAREQETVAELRELDRLKSDFAAAASHELRTPLTTIRGYAELLQDRLGTADPDTRDAIDTIARQAAHLQRLVGNLLREAQLEHGNAAALAEEPTSVPIVLDEVRRGFPGAFERIRLRVEPDLRRSRSTPSRSMRSSPTSWTTR
jgi:signal transduction histidine kinase